MVSLKQKPLVLLILAILVLLVRAFLPSDKNHQPFVDVVSEGSLNGMVDKRGDLISGQLSRQSLKSKSINHSGFTGEPVAADSPADNRLKRHHDRERLSANSLVYEHGQSTSLSKSLLGSLSSVGRKGLGDGSAQLLEGLDRKILQGKVLTAILETAINSELHGMTRAVLTEDVMSEDGSCLLLQKGSRLIGEYQSTLDSGQGRILVIWKRVITPNHWDIKLDSPGSDALGRSGLVSHVDRHFMRMFGTGALLSILGAGVNDLGAHDGNAYSDTVSQSFLNTANESLSRDQSIKPTVYVNQGAVIKILVARDIDFHHVMEGRGGYE